MKSLKAKHKTKATAKAGIKGACSLFLRISKCKIICKIPAISKQASPSLMPQSAPIIAIIMVSASPIASMISPLLLRFIHALTADFITVIPPAKISEITKGELMAKKLATLFGALAIKAQIYALINGSSGTAWYLKSIKLSASSKQSKMPKNAGFIRLS